MTISFENRVGTNSNTHITITFNTSSVINLSCKSFRVQMIDRGSESIFQVRGDHYNNIFEFRFDDVLLPVAVDNDDLLDKITDILNCCTC